MFQPTKNSFVDTLWCRVFQPTKNSFVDTLWWVLEDVKWSLLFLVLTMWGFAGAFYILFREDQDQVTVRPDQPSSALFKCVAVSQYSRHNVIPA